MTEISLAQCQGAAQALIARLGNIPPQAHSVWIKTDVNPVSQEFMRVIAVSKNPKWKGNLNIPNEIGGVPVVEMPWPKDMV